MADYDYLLEQYRTLLHNRDLPMEQSREKTLLEAMKCELKDEHTHPRLRRSLYEKFFSAVQRVLQSSLTLEEKLVFIETYKMLVEQLKN